jgi:hypothetical protein
MKNYAYPENVIFMKVGLHSGMSLADIIISKQEEEKMHGVHYWGYSGVFCQPKKVQEFCKEAKLLKQKVKLILIETKSDYEPKIGYIKVYSEDNVNFKEFTNPVQLQGVSFSFVCKNITEVNDFCMENYNTYRWKNDGKPILEHLRFRVNKSFATLSDFPTGASKKGNVLEVELVDPYAIWLRD